MDIVEKDVTMRTRNILISQEELEQILKVYLGIEFLNVEFAHALEVVNADETIVEITIKEEHEGVEDRREVTIEEFMKEQFS